MRFLCKITVFEISELVLERLLYNKYAIFVLWKKVTDRKK